MKANYDVFIGREIVENGEEYLVTVSLPSQACSSYWTLEQACEELCDSVKAGKSVLLYQTPDQAAPLTRKIPKVTESRYQPFKPNEMDLLQKLYAEKEEMKRFPNPFENQPYLQ